MQRTLPCIMLDADFYAILGSGKHELKETRHIQSPCSSGVNKRYREVAILFHCFRFRHLVSTKKLPFHSRDYFFVCLFMRFSHYSSTSSATESLGTIKLCNEKNEQTKKLYGMLFSEAFSMFVCLQD